MTNQKHLGQRIRNELNIFLLLCHFYVWELQQPGRNFSNQKSLRFYTLQLSRTPLLEAVTLTKLQIPTGTANLNYLFKCNPKHKASTYLNITVVLKGRESQN